MKLVEEAESMIERGAARNWIELGSVGNKKIGREKGRALNDERGSFSLISFPPPWFLWEFHSPPFPLIIFEAAIKRKSSRYPPPPRLEGAADAFSTARTCQPLDSQPIELWYRASC